MASGAKISPTTGGGGRRRRPPPRCGTGGVRVQTAEIRELLAATGQEICDADGRVIGYAAQPARFKLNRPHLARGGFLVVVRDEATGEYIGTEFDALPHPRTAKLYPAGHSEQVWRTADFEEAVRLVQESLSQPE